ncbi:MAG: hypothetical protein M1436_03655 [Acidobacteria bacterium]|nr:hypothetical protein [Acidobacteriota bacterium]
MRKRLFWLLPLLAMAAAAPEVTGKWSGIIEVSDSSSGTTINTPVQAEFEQKANILSGKIGRRQDTEVETIRNGKLEGDRVSFEVQSAETLGSVKFNLKLSGDRMEGTMEGKIDTGPISGKVHLTRQS